MTEEIEDAAETTDELSVSAKHIYLMDSHGVRVQLSLPSPTEA